MAVPGSVEVMVLAATLGFQESCTTLSFDGAIVFNDIYCHRIFPALAELIQVATLNATNTSTPVNLEILSSPWMGAQLT